MIRSFHHKGLRRFYEEDESRGLIAEHVPRIRDILARLDAAQTVTDLDLPGFRLHPLKGESKGLWAITVRANWRITFRIVDPDVFDLDYLDYH